MSRSRGPGHRWQGLSIGVRRKWGECASIRATNPSTHSWSRARDFERNEIDPGLGELPLRQPHQFPLGVSKGSSLTPLEAFNIFQNVMCNGNWTGGDSCGQASKLFPVERVFYLVKYWHQFIRGKLCVSGTHCSEIAQHDGQSLAGADEPADEPRRSSTGVMRRRDQREESSSVRSAAISGSACLTFASQIVARVRPSDLNHHHVYAMVGEPCGLFPPERRLRLLWECSLSRGKVAQDGRGATSNLWTGDSLLCS